MKKYIIILNLFICQSLFSQESDSIKIIEGLLPKIASLQVDSLFVKADDWVYNEDSNEIYILRGDSLFSSPIKQIKWKFLGNDSVWRGKQIFKVYKDDQKLAVFFISNIESSKSPPLLWFLGKSSKPFSPANQIPSNTWRLFPKQKIKPDHQGLFVEIKQSYRDVESRKITFDSSAIYWLDLKKQIFTRLPFTVFPDFYDETLRYAYFPTGKRFYPKEGNEYSTFHRYDTKSGNIERDLPDPWLNTPSSTLSINYWDERPSFDLLNRFEKKIYSIFENKSSKVINCMVFSNGNSLVSFIEKDKNFIDRYGYGNVLLNFHEKNEWIDIFKNIRRKPNSIIVDSNEVFDLKIMDFTGFIHSPVCWVRIKQGFMAKSREEKGKNLELDNYWDTMRYSGIGPVPLDTLVRYGFLWENGQLVFIDTSFLGKHSHSFQTLIFNPSGVILGRDWNSGNLRWWSFDIPK
jgi:hypothetical protein